MTVAKTKTTAILCRLSPSDKARLTIAAKEAGSSLSSYLLTSALDRLAERIRAERRKKVSEVEPEEIEAVAALAALVESGLSATDATRRIRAVLADKPRAEADEILAAAFAMNGGA